MKKLIFIALLLICSSLALNAQKVGLPVIGAQVFLQPGQNKVEIENWFKILRDNNMSVCRLFLIETQMHQPDGTWEFSNYDWAFRMAEKYGIKVFATFYPKEIATNWRLGKLPQSKEHLQQLKGYFDTMVEHFGKCNSL